ncbi:energy-coupling factor transporter transmembrane protein EcfT, partial [Enterococcus faecium]|nr:energy-coupling factor transporter transmembrane protein EcfT [Enterococcus faecium]
MTLHKESLAKLDPRTKLLLLIVVNIIVLNAYDYGNRLYIKFALFALTAGLLLCEGEVSAVVKGIIIYISAQLIRISGMADAIPLVLNIFINVYVNIIAKMFPCLFCGYYLLNTTEVSSLLEAFRKMKIPEKINLPLSVV